MRKGTSLSLLQGYSLAEEEEEEATATAAEFGQIHYRSSSDDGDDADVDTKGHQQGRRSRRNFKEKKDMLVGAVVKAKAQLVGIHERVRSDIEGSKPSTSVTSTAQDGVKRVASATNPNADDVAQLLWMFLQSGIPKTYSSARGMVCPVCGDRPLLDTNEETKKNGS